MINFEKNHSSKLHSLKTFSNKLCYISQKQNPIQKKNIFQKQKKNLFFSIPKSFFLQYQKNIFSQIPIFFHQNHRNKTKNSQIQQFNFFISSKPKKKILLSKNFLQKKSKTLFAENTAKSFFFFFQIFLNFSFLYFWRRKKDFVFHRF